VGLFNAKSFENGEIMIKTNIDFFSFRNRLSPFAKIRRNRAVIIATLFGIVSAVGISTSSSAEGELNIGSSFSDSGFTHPISGHPVNVEENYTKIYEELLAHNPTEWGGAFVDGDQLVVVSVSRSIRDAEKILADLGIREGVEVRLGTTSMADLDKGTERVVSELAGLQDVFSVGPQYSSGSLLIGVENSDKVETEVRESISNLGLPVVLYDSGQPKVDVRWFDLEPYYGGNLIVFSNSNYGARGICSGAFTWENSTSNSFIVSASHCSVRPGSSSRSLVSRINVLDNSLSLIGNAQWFSGNSAGTISGRHGDLSVVKLGANPTAPKVYVGPNNTPWSKNVLGRLILPENWTGSTLRSSGSGGYVGNGDGEIAPDWISMVNQTINYSNGQSFSNLTVAEHISDCFGGGDSGGAVYLQSGTSAAKAVGVISGDNGGGALWINCRNYYTPIHYVASDFGGSLQIAP
jgi:hypothetical protein